MDGSLLVIIVIVERRRAWQKFWRERGFPRTTQIAGLKKAKVTDRLDEMNGLRTDARMAPLDHMAFEDVTSIKRHFIRELRHGFDPGHYR